MNKINNDGLCNALSFLSILDLAWNSTSVCKNWQRLIMENNDVWGKRLIIYTADAPLTIEHYPWDKINTIILKGDNIISWINAIDQSNFNIQQIIIDSNCTDLISSIKRSRVPMIQYNRMGLCVNIINSRIQKMTICKRKLTNAFWERVAEEQICSVKVVCYQFEIDKFFGIEHTTLIELDLSDCHGITISDEDMYHIAQCRTLRILQLNGPITDIGLEYLRNLHHLGLYNCDITQRKMQHIVSMPIRALTFAHSDVTDDHLQSLRGRALIRLTLINCPNITSRCMDTINTMKIEELNIFGCSISDVPKIQKDSFHDVFYEEFIDESTFATCEKMVNIVYSASDLQWKFLNTIRLRRAILQ